MRIVADENIPLLDEFFAGFCEIRRLPGRSIDAAAANLLHHHCGCSGGGNGDGPSQQCAGELPAGTTPTEIMKVPMTHRGAEQLREELRHRKSELRPKIIAAVDEARSHGDLKENAEYAAAREQHGFNEGRITEIEGKLSNAQVIDPTQLPQNGRVVFGVTVDLSDVDTGDDLRYQIVGEDEADIKENRISVNSPIARALIGKSEGDSVEVVTPKGSRELEILAVHYL